MRVRFPSPAPSHKGRSGQVPPPSISIGHSLGAQFVPHTCHTADRSCVPLPAFLPLILGSADLADQPAERLSDGLVTVLGRVLVDHRRAHAGMAEAGHQLLEGRAGRRRQRAARMSEIMKMQVWQADRSPRLVPDPQEVAPPQLPALRPDEYQASVPGLREALHMPAKLWHKLSGKGHCPPTGLRFRGLRQQAALVWLGHRLHDSDLAGVQVDVLPPQPGQLAPAQISEGGQEHQDPISHRNGVCDGEHGRQRDGLPLGRLFLTRALDSARIAAHHPVLFDGRCQDRMQQPVWDRAIPGMRLQGSEWAKFRPQLAETKGDSYPVDRAIQYSAWSFAPSGVVLLEGGANDWSFGMGLNTRGAAGIYYVDVLSANKAEGTVRIRNRPAEKRNNAVQARTRSVEAALVHPLLRGRDIDAWEVHPSGYVVVPQDPNDLKYSLTEGEMVTRFPETLKWLRSHAAVLRKRSVPTKAWHIAGPDWFRLQGSFEYMAGAYLIVVPEQRMPPPAAVIEPAYDLHLGRKAMPLPNHKVVFCSVATLDEALYLAALINSTQIQALLGSFASQTAVSPTTLARLPIPPYNSSSSRVQEIVNSSRTIHSAANKKETRDHEQGHIDSAFEYLLGEGGVTQGVRAVAPSVRQRPKRPATAPQEPEFVLPGFEDL
jgi:hypothetical protein